MIVDDSVVARTVISRMVESADGFEIAALAVDANDALSRLSTGSVDIIILDVMMPGMDGLTALPRLIAAGNGARVLIVSSACADGAAATVQALTLGAADTLLKPGAGNLAGRFSAELIERLRRIGPRRRQQPAVAPPAQSNLRTLMPRFGAIDCVGIGASTGGLHALSALLRALPPKFSAPILVTQHLPAVFMPYFASQLREIAGRPTEVARDGMPLRSGEILVAPGDGHLRVAEIGGNVRVRLDRQRAASGCMPSVDPMFESLANAFGAGALGVVLSGMGRDGAMGAVTMVDAGAEIWAQDAASSVVWGMPGAVASAGLATHVLPPGLLADKMEARGSRTTDA